jgi:transcription initiation factor TFIIE subunit beta
MRLQDLAIVTNTPIDTDLVLLERFRAHDKIKHDPKTDLYSYKVRSVFCSVIHRNQNLAIP